MLLTTLIVAAFLCLLISAFQALFVVCAIIAVVLFPTPLVVIGASVAVVLTSAFSGNR